MPPVGNPAPARLMSFAIISMAARMLACVSARWVTRIVASIPVLNRLAMAAITMRPSAIATISSSSVNPSFEFCFFMIVRPMSSAPGRNQTVDGITAGCRGPSRDVTDGHRDLFEGGVHGAIRVENVADCHLPGEVAEAHGLIVGGAQDAIRAGQYDALRSGGARRIRGAIRVVGGVHQTISTGAQQLGSACGENACGEVGDLCKRDLLRIARGVDTFHRLHGLL